MSRFVVQETPLAGVKVVERQVAGDERGFLSRLFCAAELAAAGWQKPIAQINHTYTAQPGTVRGLHCQLPPMAEMKLVTCLQGEVWDVAVDVRADSPTFLQWFGVALSAENHRALLLPEGVAHGFQTLTAGVDLVYCHSAAYAPECEAGLHPLDGRLAIPWPLPVACLSERDRRHPLVDENFIGVRV